MLHYRILKIKCPPLCWSRVKSWTLRRSIIFSYYGKNIRSLNDLFTANLTHKTISIQGPSQHYKLILADKMRSIE